MEIQEHAGAGDLPGIKAELDALLANLGAIPTEVKLGNDDIKVVASISGKVSAEAKAGPVKIEGEGSSEGIEGGVTVGPVKGSFGQKGVKAEIKVGDLIKVSGGLQPKARRLGRLVGEPRDRDDRQADHARGGREGLQGHAGDVLQERGRAGRAIATTRRRSRSTAARSSEAVKDAVEKAQKSAAQAKKPGWRVGVDIKGDGSGGISGGITLTWIW